MPTKRKPEDEAEALRLLNAAMRAVTELSNHFERTGRDPRRYEANRAWHVLYAIDVQEPPKTWPIKQSVMVNAEEKTPVLPGAVKP